MSSPAPKRGHRPGRHLDLEAVRHHMHLEDLTSTELAGRLGVSPSTARNVLAGDPVSLDRAADWAEALGVRLRDILSPEDLDELRAVL